MAVLLLVSSLLLHSAIIDRIAVSVGNLAITASDLDREIRVAAFLDRNRPISARPPGAPPPTAWWSNA